MKAYKTDNKRKVDSCMQSRKLLPQHRRKPDRAQNGKLVLMALPMMVVVFVMSYIPMAGAVVAFKEYNYKDGIFGSPFIQPFWKNFEFLFKSPDTWRMIRNTVGYNLAFIVLTLVISVFIALMLNEIRSRKALKVYQTAMFIPYFLSWVVVSYVAYAFLNPRLGYLNAIAKVAGGETIDWYNTPEVWVGIIIVMQIWKTVGMNVLMYYASLMSIDPTYYEAAAIEGASRWQQIKRITLPALYPMMIILTILAVGKIMNSDFGLFYQLPMDSKTLYATTDVLETYVYRALIQNGNIGMSSSAGLLKSVIGLILVLITNKVVKKINPDYAMY